MATTSSTSSLVVTGRDLQLFRLIDWTPATTSQILKASQANTQLDHFPSAFESEAAVRKRTQKLVHHGLLQRHPLPLATGGRQQNYYVLTNDSYRMVCNAEKKESRGVRRFEPIPPSRVRHTFDLARIIVHTIASARPYGVRIQNHWRENEVTVEAGGRRKKPDSIVQLTEGQLRFTHLFEIDEHTESIDSRRENAVAETIRCYYDEQEHRLQSSKRTRFRVTYFTDTDAHMLNILAVAKHIIRHPRRRFVYVTTFDRFLNTRDALHVPLFLDHHGHWQSLVDSSYLRPHVQPLYPRLDPVTIEPQSSTCKQLPKF